ncbi:MAG: ABC transporter substrate-binding protein, partial [Longimicrobiales bacterium]
VEWEQGQFLRFKANENYFKGAPNIDEIVYVLFANTDTLFQALQNGEVDAVAELRDVHIPTSWKAWLSSSSTAFRAGA